MNHHIQAIETRYQGHRFRSRLEARRAVFLNHLGVSWEYEREGYELPNGDRYLPDFWLPAEQCFLEVKGEAPSERDQLRAALLAHLTSRPVYMLSGQIGKEAITEYRGKPLYDDEVETWVNQSPDVVRRVFAVSEALLEELAYPGYFVPDNYAHISDRFVHLDFDPDSGRLALWEPTAGLYGEDYQDKWGRWRSGTTESLEDFWMDLYAIGGPYLTERVRGEEPYEFQGVSQLTVDAVKAARSARFEFGDSGPG